MSTSPTTLPTELSAGHPAPAPKLVVTLLKRSASKESVARAPEPPELRAITHATASLALDPSPVQAPPPPPEAAARSRPRGDASAASGPPPGSSPPPATSPAASDLGWDEKVVEAMTTGSVRDKQVLLQAQGEMRKFLAAQAHRQPLGPLFSTTNLNSYQRMLVHCLGDTFGLKRTIESGRIILEKTPTTAWPADRLETLTLRDDASPSATPSPSAVAPESNERATEPSSAPPPPTFRIMSRTPSDRSGAKSVSSVPPSSASSSSHEADGDPSATNGTKPPADLSFEARQAAYLAARNRIFAVPASSAASNTSAASSTSGSEAGDPTRCAEQGNSHDGQGRVHRQTARLRPVATIFDPAARAHGYEDVPGWPETAPDPADGRQTFRLPAPSSESVRLSGINPSHLYPAPPQGMQGRPMIPAFYHHNPLTTPTANRPAPLPPYAGGPPHPGVGPPQRPHCLPAPDGSGGFAPPLSIAWQTQQPIYHPGPNGSPHPSTYPPQQHAGPLEPILQPPVAPAPWLSAAPTHVWNLPEQAFKPHYPPAPPAGPVPHRPASSLSSSSGSSVMTASSSFSRGMPNGELRSMRQGSYPPHPSSSSSRPAGAAPPLSAAPGAAPPPPAPAAMVPGVPGVGGVGGGPGGPVPSSSSPLVLQHPLPAKPQWAVGKQGVIRPTPRPQTLLGGNPALGTPAGPSAPGGPGGIGIGIGGGGATHPGGMPRAPVLWDAGAPR